MLSIFGKRKLTNHALYQTVISGGHHNIEAVYNEVPEGASLRIPVVITMGDQTRETKVRHFLSTDQVKQIADMLHIIKTKQVIKEVVVNDPAANRPKFCKNNHPQISENVIHWPNGKEDCRTCYMSWPSTIAKKEREAERAAAKGGKK